MCRHRPDTCWGRRWQTFTLVFLAVFTAMETAALATEGTDGTLSAYLRLLAGTHPSCRHTPAGRGALVVVLVWLAAHVGWGLAGVDIGRRKPPVGG